MAAICKLCDKKLGFFDGSYSLQEITVCEDCYHAYEKVLDSIPTALAFEANIEEFHNKFFGREGIEQIVKHLIELREDYLRENGERIKLQEEEERRQREEEQRQREEAKQREIERQKRSIETERQNREQIQEEYKVKIDHLTQTGYEGYYEYKVISLLDESGFFRKKSGAVDTVAMTQVLNNLGLDGWHLVTAYSNELGKNALSGGVGGAMLGVNSTVDENILIFERFVKIGKS